MQCEHPILPLEDTPLLLERVPNGLYPRLSALQKCTQSLEDTLKLRYSCGSFDILRLLFAPEP